MDFKQMVARIHETHPHHVVVGFACNMFRLGLKPAKLTDKVLESNLRGRGLYGKIPGVKDPVFLLPGINYTYNIICFSAETKFPIALHLIFYSHEGYK